MKMTFYNIIIFITLSIQYNIKIFNNLKKNDNKKDQEKKVTFYKWKMPFKKNLKN